MKLRALFTALILGAAALTAVPAKAQAMDPCTVYLCMAGISGFGLSGGPACVVPIQFWHAAAPAGLAVYDNSGFDAPASYAARSAYLMTCPGATTGTNAAVFAAIMAQWGSIP